MISLEDPNQFLDKCKSRISPIIGIDEIGFNKPRRAPASKGVWELNGYYQSQAETPRQVHKVLPLASTPLHDYWISTQLAFIFKRGEFILDWISMAVFEGDKSDQVKKAIFRAEWATNDSSQRTSHAQPHWHVYTSWPDDHNKVPHKMGAFEPDASQMADFKAIDISKSASSTPKVTKFHFAMATQWPEMGVGAHIEELMTNKVLAWIEGCLSYIVDQLSYIDGT